MKRMLAIRPYSAWLAFAFFFGISLALGAVLAQTNPVNAAPSADIPNQTGGGYAGPQSCGNCHKDIVEAWSTTRHAQAFSSPIFQRDWVKEGSDFTCLECHVTGYDATNATYAYEGVTCESCHGPFQPGHPNTLMPVKPDADLCSTCHKTTTDEWHASPHFKARYPMPGLSQPTLTNPTRGHRHRAMHQLPQGYGRYVCPRHAC